MSIRPPAELAAPPSAPRGPRLIAPGVGAWRACAGVTVFVAVFVCVLGTGMEINGNFHDLGGGGAQPASGAAPLCLALVNTPSDKLDWLPDTLRLGTSVADHIGAGRWYDAFEDGDPGWEWRPAGPDSIDIARSAGPTMRIPARGAHRVGRGGWRYLGNLWNALTAPEWRVDAIEVRCPAEHRFPKLLVI